MEDAIQRYRRSATPTCRWCEHPIWLNEPSGEWFHESTAERACTESVGSTVAAPAPEVAEYLGGRE